MGVPTAHAVAPHLAKLDYDSDKDLVPVDVCRRGAQCAVNNALPVGLVRLAKQNPYLLSCI